MSAAPHILQDRTDLSQVADEHPELVSELRSTRIGIKAGRSALQFCGLVDVSEERSFVFLPRKSYTGIVEQDLKTARLTMRALARFGQDMTDRPGVSTGGEGDTGRLAVVADLAKDFLLYGIFSERSRHRSRTSGKPDWPRTVVREQSYVGSDGSVVYQDIRTTRTKDSHHSLLAQVQAAVMLEIIRQHGWWINWLTGREDELKRYTQPRLQRALWATHLRLLLPELYASRAILLANWLISYLANNSALRTGETYYGVEDFHTVWEHMLRQVLNGVESGWNSRLPRPAYRRNDGKFSVQDRGLQTDLVLRDPSGTLHVVDAKYYDATYIGNAPGLPDIIKQFFYDIALSSIASGEKVKGCFLFPSRTGEAGVFNSVVMYHRDGSVASEFPTIDCRYIDMVNVLRAYTEGRKIFLFSP
jgi:hypothetical protein